MVKGEQLFQELFQEIDDVFEQYLFSREADEGEDRLLAAIQLFVARLGQLAGMYLTLVHHLPKNMMNEQYSELVSRHKDVVTDDIAAWSKRIAEGN